MKFKHIKMVPIPTRLEKRIYNDVAVEKAECVRKNQNDAFIRIWMDAFGDIVFVTIALLFNRKG